MLMTVIMLVLLAATLGVFAFSVRNRLKVLMAARPSDRFNSWWERVDEVLVVMFGQKKMFARKVDVFAGIMHALIFWGFMVLLVRSINLVGSAFTSDWHWDVLTLVPWVGGWLSHAYAFLKDITEAVVALMIIIGLYRRIVVKPERLTINYDGFVILGLILTLMVTDFLMDGAAFANPSTAAVTLAERAYSPVGSLFATAYAALNLSPDLLLVLRQVFYWIHVVSLFFFLNYLPYSKHIHVLTVLFNVFFFNHRKGFPLETVRDIEKEFEKETPVIGAQKLEQLSWSHLLNAFTCTECGRCALNCPAKLSGKALNPKAANEVLKHEIDHIQPFILGCKKAEEREALTPLIQAIQEEVIWDCTTCRSCEQNCPVMNEYVQGFVDMRRYLTMMESNFPNELNTVFKNLENKSNPWGMPMGDREKWCEDLAVPKRRDLEVAPDYLFFVGCAGAFDDASIKTARAIVKILNAAGVSYAILGTEEGCTGDTARRLGNEYLYQMQAQANIEMFNTYGVKKIITMCPHCFQTIGNEYPDLGGSYEVIHHTQLIQQLLAEGRIKLDKRLDKAIAFHDSCYLGRYNEIYQEPREVLRAIPGTRLVEADRSFELGMCCGAGGGHFWMEEHKGTRMNHLRTEQLAEVKPDLISTACPFCKVMLRDGVADKSLDEQIKVKDVAELVADAMPAPSNVGGLATEPAPGAPAA
jgi:Fe-S oxidoreductase